MTGMRRKRLTEAEDRVFTALWEAGASRSHIAAELGLAGASSINSIRCRLGLAGRQTFVRTKARRTTQAAPAPEPEMPPLPEMPPHPFWTPVLDLAVMATRGKYPALAALAGQMGKPMSAVQQRWHQLRAA
jgi:hypothetical protein